MGESFPGKSKLPRTSSGKAEARSLEKKYCAKIAEIAGPTPCLILLLGISSIALGQFEKGSVEDLLIQLDKAWTCAELKGDKKAAGALIADDYVGTTQRGEIENKAQYLASVVPNADMVKSDDYKATIHGNMAIMTHRSNVEGVRNIQFRSTHVWMKRGRQWLIVAHHGSEISPSIE